MPPPTETNTLSLHDALPISTSPTEVPPYFWTIRLTRPTLPRKGNAAAPNGCRTRGHADRALGRQALAGRGRSEDHTSELQSRQYLVCRLLLEKNKEQASHAV